MALTTKDIADEIRRLSDSIFPAEVHRGRELRQRFARRLRRYEARVDSGPGRRRARADHEDAG